jgi:dihydropteroate synthase
VLDSALWRVGGHRLSLRRPLVMGILNVTPDSFSDGGAHPDADAAIRAGLAMVEAGADIVDVGGESTRPGSTPVETAVEAGRTLPVVRALADEGVVVSIDTSKPDVAAAAIDVGASIVNDVTGMRDPNMRRVCASAGAGVVIMHMQGDPTTMQSDPVYDDVVSEVATFLSERCLVAIESGIPLDAIAIDPGIGFGKTLDHNLAIMRHLEAFTHLGYPVLIGTSRKGFLGSILEPVRGPTSPVERDAATAASLAIAVASGAAILRVHNVPLGVDVAMTAKAMVPERS